MAAIWTRINTLLLLIVLLVLLAAVGMLAAVVRGGPLDPSGVPASTMKTLDEVEPRIPINPQDIPFVIDAPGSYYLTGDAAVPAGEIGIEITVSSVTLDMQGFTLLGNNEALDGVRLEGGGFGLIHVTVIDGNFDGFVDDGLDAESASHGRFAHLHANRSGDVGLHVGVSSMLSDCSARESGTGISVKGRGIVSDCVANQNNGIGIVATGALVRDSIASGNDSHGIQIGNGSVALNNQAEGNGVLAADGAGIIATGTTGLNRIDGNTAIGNDLGIDLASSQNVMIRNFAADNTTNYDVGLLNTTGPIGTPSTNNAWTNVEY